MPVEMTYYTAKIFGAVPSKQEAAINREGRQFTSAYP